MDELRIATRCWIAADPAHVWQILTDFPAYISWNPYLVQVDGDAISGTLLTVHAVAKPDRTPMVQQVELVAIAPYAMHWRGGMDDRSQFVGNHYFTLTADMGGTRFDHVEDFGGTMAAEILSQFRGLIRGNFERFNSALKRRAETG